MRLSRFCIALALIINPILNMGCDDVINSKPEAVLSEYIQAALSGDLQKAYSFLSSNYKKSKPFDVYVSEKRKHADSKLTKMFIDKTTFKIVNVDVKNDIASVKVDTTTVDLEIITREFANAAFGAARTGKSFDDIQKDFAEKYKTQDIPLHNYISNHTLIKEGGQWKVNPAS